MSQPPEADAARVVKLVPKPPRMKRRPQKSSPAIVILTGLRIVVPPTIYVLAGAGFLRLLGL
jgi:hypothetical protein